MTLVIPTTQPVRILVVEDDFAAASSLDALLKHYGYDVSVAGNVAEAIERLAVHPQIILLDLMLPDGNGSLVLDAMRIGKINARVVVMTAVSDKLLLRKIESYGPHLLMRKPLNVLNLLAELHKSAA